VQERLAKQEAEAIALQERMIASQATLAQQQAELKAQRLAEMLKSLFGLISSADLYRKYIQPMFS
jgi:hypothetical protein